MGWVGWFGHHRCQAAAGRLCRRGGARRFKLGRLGAMGKPVKPQRLCSMPHDYSASSTLAKKHGPLPSAPIYLPTHAPLYPKPWACRS